MTEPRPILIAYDGSEGARRAIAEAGRAFGPGRAAVVTTVWCSLAALAPSAISGLPPGVAQASVDQLDAATEREAAAQAQEGAKAARAAGFEAEPQPTRRTPRSANPNRCTRRTIARSPAARNHPAASRTERAF